MVVMVMVLCGQRVQAVHDHGGRRVGMTCRGTAYQKRIRCFCRLPASLIIIINLTSTDRSREGVNDRARASQKNTQRGRLDQGRSVWYRSHTTCSRDGSSLTEPGAENFTL